MRFYPQKNSIHSHSLTHLHTSFTSTSLRSAPFHPFVSIISLFHLKKSSFREWTEKKQKCCSCFPTTHIFMCKHSNYEMPMHRIVSHQDLEIWIYVCNKVFAMKIRANFRMLFRLNFLGNATDSSSSTSTSSTDVSHENGTFSEWNECSW